MLKFLVLVALILAVLYFFNWYNRRPPGDWRRGDDGDDAPGPTPTHRLGLDSGNPPDTEPEAPPRETDPAGDSRRDG
ncbi:hypothetical protein K1X12_07520 [Hyphomonas sp. WL0036]|uniref:hypothetical protein n=1 Tax=Hyphomonas sediminis TaxID=2866160 RepID=UPI001C8088C4|nr:hypothetical protein [Hyphomonas sediminis]MBY9066744.1 hypothetical protein [Hyphomonas sediminis]